MYQQGENTQTENQKHESRTNFAAFSLAVPDGCTFMQKIDKQMGR